METFTINGRNIRARELDFNFLCLLGENDIDLNDLGKKALPALRQYVAFCMNVDADIAGAEINNHIINGGSLEELVNVFKTKVEDSDFFRALGQKAQETATETTKKSTKKSTDQEA